MTLKSRAGSAGLQNAGLNMLRPAWNPLKQRRLSMRFLCRPYSQETGGHPQIPRTRLTYDGSNCGEFLAFPTVCHVVLRVVDDDGHPVPAAGFDVEHGRGTSGLSDSFGRIFETIDPHGTLRGIVRKGGYRPAPVSAQCVLEKRTDMQLRVILHRQ